MTNPRRSYTQAEEVALTTEVEGYCPVCGHPLFYAKRARSYKGYELAHIYPLNPTPEEILELSGVRLLNQDVNHPGNIIPLCTRCHPRFDKPRTRAEYEELATIKRRLLERATQRALMSEFPLEKDIVCIITSLYDVDFGAAEGLEPKLDVKRLDDKLDASMPGPTRQKIRHEVIDYYQSIKRAFRELELQVPAGSEAIYSQVRTYYVKQKTLGLPQSTIFYNIVDWIQQKSSCDLPEAAGIIASFFVQNCEVFD